MVSKGSPRDHEANENTCVFHSVCIHASIGTYAME